MTRLLTSGLLLSALSLAPAVLVSELQAQQEGPVPTQILVTVDPKATPPTASDLTVQVDKLKEPLTSWTPVSPGGAQVAILIDDGLRESVGRELNTLKAFVQDLPPGVEVLIGYMQNGRVVEASPFTADHTAAAASLHLPDGMPGSSASPYFCLSDFVKKWPSTVNVASNTQPDVAINRGGQPLGGVAPPHKARFVLMITNGVDPYNGSTSIMNQDSPYVDSAVTDAQRAGVQVYSIYYADAGFRGNRGSFSGQSYLAEVAHGTGGTEYFEGTGNPVSMAPFLKAFQNAIFETYIATFNAPAPKNANELVQIKILSDVKTKLDAPQEVHPGNME